uniref:Kelch repeat-containing protein n=1 Tax=Meloidogyne javanica TaxID=6303 RepID=A0A915N0H2_MELJA
MTFCPKYITICQRTPGSHLNSGELFNLDFSKETENFKIDGKLLNYNNIRGFSCSAFCQIEGDGGFIFGGYDGNECLNQIIKIEEIEPHNANLLSPLPFGLKNATALPSLDKQKIWIIGGIDPLECHAVAFQKINSKGIGFIIGGFDGIGLRSEILIINLNNGNILEEISNVKLLKPKENCGATCFCIDGEKEFLAVFGGWDGYNVINDIELFEILQEPPWLRREESSKKFENLDICGRNRPAVICL